MPTTKQRVNMSLPRLTQKILRTVAKRDKMPVAAKALELLELALELEEDIVLERRAVKRDTKGARFVSHAKAWGV